MSSTNTSKKLMKLMLLQQQQQQRRQRQQGLIRRLSSSSSSRKCYYYYYCPTVYFGNYSYNVNDSSRSSRVVLVGGKGKATATTTAICWQQQQQQQGQRQRQRQQQRLSFINTIIQQQQQQRRWKSSKSSSSSNNNMSTSATSQLLMLNDDDDGEGEEEEKCDDDDNDDNDDVVPTTSTIIDNENNDESDKSDESESEVIIHNQPKPWLISKYGPFPIEIQNEAPILRSSDTQLVKEWKIPHPDDIAGMIFLGPNGIGKSQLIQSIIKQKGGNSCQWYTPGDEDDDAINTSSTTSSTRRPTSSIPKWKEPRIQHVSFEAHQELLNGDPNMGVLKCISDGGQLNKAAQFLIVRLGLYPLLKKRNITTLSTGEIRKVMLIRALSRKPDLLILDNALDGLDIESRNNLKDIITKTLQGFKQDILVQGITAKATSRTQVMLLTHRSEEIVTIPDVESTVTYPILTTKTNDNNDDNNNNSNMELKTELINGRSGDDLLSLAMNNNMNNMKLQGGREEEEDVEQEQQQQEQQQELYQYPWDDPTLTVTKEMIQSWWKQSSSSSSDYTVDTTSVAAEPIVKVDKLSIRRTKKIDENNDDGITSESKNVVTTLLLDDLDWSIFPGDVWLLAGHNGAGKSTLSRLLVMNDDDPDDDDALLLLENNLIVPDPSQIGWCSTELHMQMSSSTKPTIEVLTRDYTTDITIAMQMAEWMRLPTYSTFDDNPKTSFWNRPFHQLSQGQQKMVLITAAIACQPKLLILDEPCQGLDLYNRRRVLSMMELLCSQCASNNNINMSLIYITHHPDEWIPSIKHVLHLQNGKSIYDGSMSEYDPETLLS